MHAMIIFISHNFLKNHKNLDEKFGGVRSALEISELTSMTVEAPRVFISVLPLNLDDLIFQIKNLFILKFKECLISIADFKADKLFSPTLCTSINSFYMKSYFHINEDQLQIMFFQKQHGSLHQD